MRTIHAATITLLAVLVAGCESPNLERMYCAGGVVNGRSDGGDCLLIYPDKLDSDPNTIGSALLVSRDQRYSLRRISDVRYELHLSGARVATLDKNGAWLNVTFDDKSSSLSLRSDAPSIFR